MRTTKKMRRGTTRRMRDDNNDDNDDNKENKMTRTKRTWDEDKTIKKRTRNHVILVFIMLLPLLTPNGGATPHAPQWLRLLSLISSTAYSCFWLVVVRSG